MSAPALTLAQESAIARVLDRLLADRAFVQALDGLAVDVGELVREFLADQVVTLAEVLQSDEQIDYVIAGLAGWFLGSSTDEVPLAPDEQLRRFRLRLFAAAYVAGCAERLFAAQRAGRVM